MKIRLAKKIMKKSQGAPKYLRMIIDGLDVRKGGLNIKQYWEPRWALYFAIAGGQVPCKKNHRIFVAIKRFSRWNDKRRDNEFKKMFAERVFGNRNKGL